MQTLWQDLRYGARLLIRQPGFALVAVITLALGIGANTAIFSVVNAVLLRPLPYPQPEQLMMLSLTAPVWSYPEFEIFRQRNGLFEQVAGFKTQDGSLTGTGNPERVRVGQVSASYFPLLGVQAFAGRTFLAEEDTVGTPPVALVSYEFWQRRFSGDRAFIGQTLAVDKVPVTVVGILPPGFKHLAETADVYLPLIIEPTLRNAPDALQISGGKWFQVVGRLRHGLTLEQARAQMTAAGQQVVEALKQRPGWRGETARATVTPLRESRNDPAVQKSILVLLGAVTFVLLIACSNLANLSLARNAARRREIAVCLALGAPRRRIVRQLLTESVLLAVLGGTAGLLLAFFATDWLSAFRPQDARAFGVKASAFADFDALRPDAWVLGFTCLISLASGVLSGLLPALQASRADLTEALKETGISAARGLGSWRRLTGRGLLVAGEVALALMLLIGAGLLLKSLAKMQNLERGFEPERLLTLRIAPDSATYKDNEKASALHTQLLERLATLPGVVSVSVGKSIPGNGRNNQTNIKKLDDQPLPRGKEPLTGFHFISPNHFRTLGTPLLRGRDFTPQDRAGTPNVAIINEAVARKLALDDNPLGRRLTIFARSLGGDWTAEVVGVVRDIQYNAVEDEVAPDVYLPNLQRTVPSAALFIRTQGAPAALIPAVRREVLAVDRDLAIFDVKTGQERIGSALSKSRFGAWLLAVFAGLALLLSAFGVYGVIAYVVAQRTREIGVRMALGARRIDIFKLIVGQGAALVVPGLAAGLLGAFGLTRVLSGLLYSVTATDPWTFVGVSALLAAVALLACYLPARRAAQVDPLSALRAD
jgi:putative ABC transport system permease protein